VNRVVSPEKLEEATQEWAQEFAQGPTLIYGYTKSAIVHGWEESSVEAAYEHQGQALYYTMQTEDFAEGRKAFLEKRPPKFRGQ
jgi:enoyl-CoA hydratase/carnithine racemase